MRRISFSMMAAALLLVAAPGFGFPDGTGIDSTGCSPCHGGSPDAGLVVSITGPATLNTGEVANYVVSIPDMTEMGAGFATELFGGGSIDAVDTGTHLVSGVVSHDQPNVGVWSYNVEVTAPVSAGTLTLQAAMLAFDDDGTSAGDIWNTNSMDITVEVPEPTNHLLFAAGILPLAGAAVLRRRSAS
jgi:hypothetical protein